MKGPYHFFKKVIGSLHDIFLVNLCCMWVAYHFFHQHQRRIRPLRQIRPLVQLCRNEPEKVIGSPHDLPYHFLKKVIGSRAQIGKSILVCVQGAYHFFCAWVAYHFFLQLFHGNCV